MSDFRTHTAYDTSKLITSMHWPCESTLHMDMDAITYYKRASKNENICMQTAKIHKHTNILFEQTNEQAKITENKQKIKVETHHIKYIHTHTHTRDNEMKRNRKKRNEERASFQNGYTFSIYPTHKPRHRQALHRQTTNQFTV